MPADPRRSQVNQIILNYLLWRNSKSPDALAGLANGLRAKKSWDRDRALMLLGEIGPDAGATVSQILPILQDRSNDSRRAAIQALEKMGPIAWEAVPALRKLLSDREFRVQAAIALLQIAPDDPAASGNAAQLIEDLLSEERDREVLALAKLREDATSDVPNLRRIADSTMPESDIVEALVAIWKIEHTPQALVALLRRIRNSSRLSTVGGGSISDIGPSGTVAVKVLMPLAICDSNEIADEETWERARAVLQMNVDEQLAEEILYAAMYSGSERVRSEAFKLAAEKAVAAAK